MSHLSVKGSPFTEAETAALIALAAGGGGGGTVDGSGTTNQITYWIDPNTLGALTVATYPSLTELSYFKGVTSAVQTQITGKASTTLNNLGTTSINASLLFGADATYDIGSSTVGVNDLHFGLAGVINFDGGDVTVTHAANVLTIAGGNVAFGTSVAPASRIVVGDTNGISSKLLTVSDRTTPQTDASASGILVDIDGGGGIYMTGNSGTIRGKYEAYDSELGVGTTSGHPLGLYTANTKRVNLDTLGVFSPGTSDGAVLGSGALMWSDLFLASGGVINFSNGDVTLTHSSNLLTLAGGDLSVQGALTATGTTTLATSLTGVLKSSLGVVSAAGILTSDFAAATLVTVAEGILSNDNDTTIPTSAAIKDYIDTRTTGGSSGWASDLQGYTYPDGVNVNTDISAANIWHTLKPIWYEVDGSGNLDLRTVAGYGTYGYDATQSTFIKDNSTEAYVVVSGNDPEIHVLTASPSLSSTAITTLTNFCVTENFNGVELDWEGFSAWTAGEYADYLDFTEDLAVALHVVGKKLILYVPPIWNTSSNGESGNGDEWDSADSQAYYELAYEDFESHSVDYLMIAVYDYHFDYGEERPGAPLKWQDEIIDFAKTKISDVNRLIIGIPAAGHSGVAQGYSPTAITYTQAAAATGFSGRERDDESGEMTWLNAGTYYWISDDTTIDIKRTRAQAKGITKIAIWHIGNNKYGTATGPDPGESSQWTTNGSSISYLTSYFWNDGHVTIGDAVNNGVVDISGASASTTFGNQDPETTIRLRNTNTTVNNWFDIVFEAADNTAAASISAQVVSQASHYADIVLATRGAGGYRKGMTISNGVIAAHVGLTPFASDGAALGTTALMWSDLFLASGGVINFNNGGVTITHDASNDGVTVASGALQLSNNIGSLAGVADMVRLGSYDLSAGNATLSLATETAVASDAALVSTHSLTVRINGTSYKIPLVTA